MLPLDALKGLVYLDDDQVTDIVCRKRNRKSDLRLENPSSFLGEGFRRGNEFLYVTTTTTHVTYRLDLRKKNIAVFANRNTIDLATGSAKRA